MTSSKSDRQKAGSVFSYLQKYYPFWDKLNRAGKRVIYLLLRIAELSQRPGFIHSERDECLGILLVLSGQVRVYMQSDEGREATLFRLGTGDICTLSASCMIDEITFDILMEAAEDSQLLVTPTCGMRRIMKDNIYAENFLYKRSTEELSEVIWSMSQMLFQSFDKRLAAWLEDERRSTGSPVIATTHDQIAKNLGSAREVVSRMLKYFEREGYVSLSRGAVTIINPKGLAALID